jgi:phosphorylated CTD-interacting factor 1
MFYDLEKYFGSKGNFNNININSGTYVSNPPFDNTIMENMCKILIKFIKNANKNNKSLSILITIPHWLDTEEYGIYKPRHMLEDSGCVTFNKVIPKDKTKFFDHYLNKLITPSDMLYIVIQSKKAKEESTLVKVLQEYFK